MSNYCENVTIRTDGSTSSARPLRRDGGRALQMIQHSLTMGDLAVVEARETSGVGPPKRGGPTRGSHCLRHPARPSPIDLVPVALEAERVVAVRPDLTAIPELGFAFPARRAALLDLLRLTTTFIARHRQPPGRSGRHLASTFGGYQGRLTGLVIRQMFASCLSRVRTSSSLRPCLECSGDANSTAFNRFAISARSSDAHMALGPCASTGVR